MTAIVSIDGHLSAPGDAAIPVLDRGFLYGDSAFEVLRTYGGKPFAMREHLLRLEASCAKIGIPTIDLALIEREIMTALDAAKNDESYVRIIITRGVTAIGLAVTEEVRCRRVIIALPLSPQPPSHYTDGIAVTTSAGVRALDGSNAAGAKASNYLPNILALESARARGAYEAISVGPGGEILEGTTSNLFIVKNGRVRTPPLVVGILGGITRAVVFDAANAESLVLEEKLLFPNDLYRADEAFITSTLREVVPVVRADGITLGDGKPGPITRRLHAAFQTRVVFMLEDARH
jgi:branched-chain amino acid aminotransferase